MASIMTTKLVFEVIGDLFSNAEKIKKFFNKCCHLITQ